MIEVARGAEAVLFKSNGFAVKVRVSKAYRIKEIDQMLIKTRSKRESGLLERARASNAVPEVVPLPEEVKDFLRSVNAPVESAFCMKYIEGETLREVLSREGDNEVARKLLFGLGKAVGKIHSLGVIHADLTPSNVIVGEGRIVLVDFGLGFFSTKSEDRAVDLYLLERSLLSILSTDLFSAVLDGYATENLPAVLAKLRAVRRRGKKREIQAMESLG